MHFAPKISAIAMVLAIASPAIGQGPVPFGFEFRVNTDAVLDPSVAVSAAEDGGFVVAWDRRIASDSALLKAQRFDADGAPVGGEIEEPIAAIEGLSVAGVEGGGFVAAFVQPSLESRLSARAFDASGTATASFDVSPSDHRAQSHDLARLDSGELVAVWQSLARMTPEGPPVADGLFVQRFEPSGELVGPLLEVSPTGSDPRLAVAGDAYVVVWFDREAEAVFGRRFEVGGSVGETFRIDLSGGAGNDGSGVEHPGGPAVAADPAGGFLVAWPARGGAVRRVVGRRLDVAGTPVGGEVEIHPGEGPGPRQVQAAIGPSGHAWVVWTDGTVEGSDLFGRLVGPTGQPASEVFGVNTLLLDRQRFPRLAVDEQGRALVIWQSRVDFTSNVQGRLFDAPKCVSDVDALCLADGRFQVEIAWRDFDDRSGSGSVVPGGGSNDSGLFWFFDPANWEVLVKVLDGCAFNGHFWVFAAATTNVEIALRVTDTATGQQREYLNPLGVAAPAITDTTALPGCPPQ